ncbi:hypothetical protein ACHAW6_000407 [Cyclotella cf. meneghiniana]
MGYPGIATWCKAINKGYFRGWNGLTSERGTSINVSKGFIPQKLHRQPSHLTPCRCHHNYPSMTKPTWCS